MKSVTRSGWLTVHAVDTMRADGSVAVNGFEALKDFDSNGDGRIEASDQRWQELLLWRDLNHDGRTDANEIERVSDSSVTVLGLDYRWIARRDGFGNEFRYCGVVEYVKSSRVHQDRYYDVFLVAR